MGTTRPLIVSDTTVLDANGQGTVTLTAAGSDWDTTLISVSTSTATLIPVATLYDGARVDPVLFLEGTYTGNANATDTAHHIQSGESITCQWIGGDPGAKATLRIKGTQTLGD